MDEVDVARRLIARFGIESGMQVIGSGPLAVAVAERLASPNVQPSSHLVVVVSNDPDDIRLAFEVVDDLGTVVLVCWDPPEFVDIDLYGDVHVRGLNVVGLV